MYECRTTSDCAQTAALGGVEGLWASWASLGAFEVLVVEQGARRDKEWLLSSDRPRL